MEKCSGNCGNCGSCGKNRSEKRIVIGFGESEISNRDLMCRNCIYKKRGNTVSCLKYENKPDEIIRGGNCGFFLKESNITESSQGCTGHCGECQNRHQ